MGALLVGLVGGCALGPLRVCLYICVCQCGRGGDVWLRLEDTKNNTNY